MLLLLNECESRFNDGKPSQQIKILSLGDGALNSRVALLLCNDVSMPLFLQSL